MKCIVKYKDKKNECYCKNLPECSKCSNGKNREPEECCIVEIGAYCTCRACGRARVAKTED